MSKEDSEETRRLLDRAADGDREAVERLLARHRQAIRKIVQHRLAPKLRARVDESDVVQETELDAFRHIDDYLARRPMPFELWLRKTALERLAKIRERHIEAAKRSVERELSLSEDLSIKLGREFADSGSSPSQRAMKQDLAQCVRTALAGLSDIDREILLMRHVERLSNTEIGYVLELSASAVNKRHVRCLRRLRESLAQSGIGESDL